MDKLEPQQPEGELAECPAKACSFKVKLPDGSRFICTATECTAYEYAKAQLAHNKERIQTLEIDYQMLSEEAKGLSDENKELKATMVKLPSEDELALWLCNHLNYTSRELAQVLREWLEVKP